VCFLIKEYTFVMNRDQDGRGANNNPTPIKRKQRKKLSQRNRLVHPIVSGVIEDMSHYEPPSETPSTTSVSKEKANMCIALIGDDLSPVRTGNQMRQQGRGRGKLHLRRRKSINPFVGKPNFDCWGTGSWVSTMKTDWVLKQFKKCLEEGGKSQIKTVFIQCGRVERIL